jgi:hypothetical protein
VKRAWAGLIALSVAAGASAHELSTPRRLALLVDIDHVEITVTQAVQAGRDAMAWRTDADRDGDSSLSPEEAKAIGERLVVWSTRGIELRCADMRLEPRESATLESLHGAAGRAAEAGEIHGTVTLRYALPAAPCALELRDRPLDPRWKTHVTIEARPGVTLKATDGGGPPPHRWELGRKDAVRVLIDREGQ